MFFKRLLRTLLVRGVRHVSQSSRQERKNCAVCPDEMG